MNIAGTIKEARERLGMTQEDLAERLEVSRQAVSKWELGASVPSAENLKLLEEVLGIAFPAPEAPISPQMATKTPFWNWKRVLLLALGVLTLFALLSVGMLMLLRPRPMEVPEHEYPYVTDIVFFDENAAPLQPDLGDGWYSFAPNRKVLMAVEFQEGTAGTADAVSLFLTPTGTETFDLRQQVGVQAVADGRHMALFALHIPESLMGHLDIVLESGGVQTAAVTLNITANPDLSPLSGEEEKDESVTLSATDINIRVGDPLFALSVYGASVQDVVWRSSDPEIAGVSATGMVWGESPGVATVTAEWNGLTVECVVHVAAAEEE